MGKKSDTYIYIVEKEGYLANHIRYSYDKENSTLNIILETSDDLINGISFNSRKALSIKSKLESHNYTAILIKPFVNKKIYELFLNVQFNSLECEYYYSEVNITLKDLEKIEIYPDKYIYGKSKYYFEDLYSLCKFLSQTIEEIHSEKEKKLKAIYEENINKINSDKNFESILRDIKLDDLIEED